MALEEVIITLPAGCSLIHLEPFKISLLRTRLMLHLGV
jgi:hypothetical protein